MEFLQLLPEKERELVLKTLKPCLKLSFEAVNNLPLYASRLSGFGYLPKSIPYPRSRESNMPLSLLTQVNFAEMPRLEDFPEKGVLAFYFDGTDDLMGLNFESPFSDNGYRVLYFPDHEEEGYSEEEQRAVFEEEELDEDSLLGPVFTKERPVKMTGRLEQSHILTDCVEAAEIFGPNLYEYFSNLLGKDSQAFEDLSEAALGSSQSHMISGYPYFTQYDPRHGDPDKEFDTLLLQLDIDGDDNQEWGIMWGDAGVGNFFINRERLKKLDFSRVLYNWDCC